MSEVVLGLDIGSTSVGWALIDLKKPKIIDTGVRIFQEGVDRDTKGAEISKNQTRREARLARRQRYRKNNRKKQLKNLLISSKLLPIDESEYQKLLIPDPYALRAKGLDDRLSLFEFGRSLFHLNQRRGFKSNRKSGKSNDDGVVIKGANELQEKIDAAKKRTIGEYFACVDTCEERIRGHYTFRAMYEHEFELLWEKQSSYYPTILTDQLKQKIKDEVIYFQRPMKWDIDTIGNCELEPEEKRCPRADWFARRFRILQDVNNLIIQNPDGTSATLTNGQREIVLENLYQSKELTFDKMRKLLDLIESQEFNLEKNGKALKGDVFAYSMRSKKLFGPKVWDEMAIDEKTALNSACFEMEDDELAAFLKEKYGFDEEQIESVFKIGLPDKYTSYSLKAIKKLMPYMEEGLLTDKAVKEAYPDRKDQYDYELTEKLPLPEDLRNPIVNKAMFEIRRVVNAIVKEYGKPDKIRIEMARDVNGSLKERDELRYKQRENEKRNEEARQKLIHEYGVHRPSRDDIIKYKLWQECGYRCPYTGKEISQSQIFGATPEFQVEHIVPYSRSLDDSYMNKTLCWTTENRLKGERTPYEYYSDKPEQYEQIMQRVNAFPREMYYKKKKFTQKEVKLDECIARELNDTRYINRETVGYLRQLGSIVTGTRGKITSELRHCWGLNNILDLTGMDIKNREDHRHHAIDAAVVALTDNKHLRELAKSKYSVVERGFAAPWKDFREELEHSVNLINVSHRVTRKVSGQLHEETSYGLTHLKDSKNQDIFVYRKPLTSLTAKMIDKIADPVVKKLVKERVESVGGDLKKAWQGPLYMKCKDADKKIPVKKVRIRDVFNNMIPICDDTGKPYRYVAPGNNHHIEIFEYKDEKGNVKRDGKVITLFESIKRSRENQPVIRKDYGDGKKFVCSLAKNESFMLQTEDGNFIQHRVQKLIQDGRIVLRPHNFAGQVKDTDLPPSIQRKNYSTLKGYKVTVDPIGRIFPAKD